MVRDRCTQKPSNVSSSAQGSLDYSVRHMDKSSIKCDAAKMTAAGSAKGLSKPCLAPCCYCGLPRTSHHSRPPSSAGVPLLNSTPATCERASVLQAADFINPQRLGVALARLPGMMHLLPAKNCGHNDIGSLPQKIQKNLCCTLNFSRLYITPTCFTVAPPRRRTVKPCQITQPSEIRRKGYTQRTTKCQPE